MVVDFFYKTLTPRVAPMVYVMMAVSAFIGFCFMTNTWVGGAESILYDSGVLVHKRLWGAVLFTAAASAEVGFVLKNRAVVLASSMVGFMAWLFASIATIDDAHWYILISVTGLHLVFHGYVYLAASLGVLERTSAYSSAEE